MARSTSPQQQEKLRQDLKQLRMSESKLHECQRRADELAVALKAEKANSAAIRQEANAALQVQNT